MTYSKQACINHATGSILGINLEDTNKPQPHNLIDNWFDEKKCSPRLKVNSARVHAPSPR